MKVFWDEKDLGWFWSEAGYDQGRAQGAFASCRSALEDYIATTETDISVEDLAILVGVEGEI